MVLLPCELGHEGVEVDIFKRVDALQGQIQLPFSLLLNLVDDVEV